MQKNGNTGREKDTSGKHFLAKYEVPGKHTCEITSWGICTLNIFKLRKNAETLRELTVSQPMSFSHSHCYQ